MKAPYSIALLKKMRQTAPPLAPKDVLENLEHALFDIESNFTTTVREVEDTMIHFGKCLWPYGKAFAEFYQSAELRHGDEHLHACLPAPLQHWYKLFKQHGGAMVDLKKGGRNILTHLSSDERVHLMKALIEAEHNLKKTTVQEVLGPFREVYKKRILEFKLLFEDIEARLDHVRTLAEREKRHPALAHELGALVREFDLALCGLRSAHCLDHIDRCEEYADGRAHDLTAAPRSQTISCA